MTQTTRPSLLARVRDPGDQHAWHEFDATYRELILRYCRRRGLQASDAEDVRQTVLINLSRSLGRFHYEPRRGRFRHYLGTCVRHAIHRHFRRHAIDARGLEDSEVAHLAAADPTLDELWEREWMLHHHRRALESVRPTLEARTLAIFERLVAGDAPGEIASAFGVGTDAVRKIKQRMRERLAAQVEKQLRVEDEGFRDER